MRTPPTMRFVFALALLVALSGCDVLASLENPEPVPVPISTVRVEGIPPAPNRTQEWDDDSTGPDVFVEIQNAGGGSIGRSEVFYDVDLTQPLLIPMPDGMEIGGDEARLYVVVFDEDFGDRFQSERLGESQSFSVEEIRRSSGSLVLLDGRAGNGREATYEVIR